VKIKDLPLSFNSKKELTLAFKRLEKAIEHNSLDLIPYTSGLLLCVKKANVAQYKGDRKCVECKFSRENEVVIQGVRYKAGEGIMDCEIFKIGHYPREINGCRRYLRREKDE
jgi:hypothetical protein